MTFRRALCLWIAAMPMVLSNGKPLSAEAIRFEIQVREPFAGGKGFGAAGPYQKISGVVHYAVEPKLLQNQQIVDLSLAPKNAAGKVEFSSELVILAPKDLSKSNGCALYDVNNRGNKLALGFFNSAGGGNAANDAGDGYLMRHGFIIVWSGWDGELLPGDGRLRLYPPVAKEPAGKPITGLVRCEIVPTANVVRSVVNWANHGSYRPTERGIETATLTIRERAADARNPIPRSQFKILVSDSESQAPGQLPKVELELSSGMKKGWIYELIYDAQDPLVHGVCFASVRDLIAAFKRGSGKDNPLLTADRKPAVRRAIGFGVSQSGRFLRELVYSGFNQDERGGKVFEAVIPHVSGGGLGSFNHRFAQPTRHVNQHDHHEYIADRFPFAYESQIDPLTGKTDGILQRSQATGTAPLVLHTQSAGEYWTRSGSLAHTDPSGTRDAKPPANVRIYLFGGTQHGPAGWPPAAGDGKYLANPGDYRPMLRALLLGLDRWAAGGAPLPPSVYPTIAAKTLVDWRQSATGFPKIRGVEYPAVIQQPPLLDLGPRWESLRIIENQPPRIAGNYRVLVPRCDADGNEIGCLSPPEVAVPLGTFTGWNLRRKEAGAENELVTLGGSYIPFAATKADRLRAADPRLSLEERYGDFERYMQLLTAHCQRLRQAGFLLPDDVERVLQRQRQRALPLFAATKKVAAEGRIDARQRDLAVISRKVD